MTEPMHCEEPADTGPKLKESEESANDLPAKVRLTCGSELQGTRKTKYGQLLKERLSLPIDLQVKNPSPTVSEASSAPDMAL